jgi:hypothetical protein
MADVIKDELFFRRSIEAVVVEGRDKDHKVCTQVTDDKLTVPPTSSVYPLLASMRLSGLYFRRPVVKTEAGSSASAVKNSRVGANGAAVNNGKLPLLERISMVYSTIVLILLWVNGIRLLSTFTPQDKTFFAITNKLMIVSWNIQCAVQMTAYFMASRSGRLDRILNDVRLKSAKCNVYTRRMAIRLTSFAWAVAVINFGFYMYTLCFTGGVNDILLAPFGSYVELPDMTPARITFLVYSVHLHLAWCFPVAMTFMLSVIIAHQFRYVSDRASSCDSRHRRIRNLGLRPGGNQTATRNVVSFGGTSG